MPSLFRTFLRPAAFILLAAGLVALQPVPANAQTSEIDSTTQPAAPATINQCSRFLFLSRATQQTTVDAILATAPGTLGGTHKIEIPRVERACEAPADRTVAEAVAAVRQEESLRPLPLSE